MAPKIGHFNFHNFGITSVTLTIETNLMTPLKLKCIKPFKPQSVPEKYTYIHSKNINVLAQSDKK